ncbi:hypothetical protein BH160DRAFT_3002 [Burkholderia sp. H160]|nr:hypothetical protein BH160DRAFT_3002 [Burkholderia sp. H160]
MPLSARNRLSLDKAAWQAWKGQQTLECLGEGTDQCP